MAWKSYRSHAQPGDDGPAGAIVSALCIGLAFAAPLLLAAVGFIRLWQWFAG